MHLHILYKKTGPCSPSGFFLRASPIYFPQLTAWHPGLTTLPLTGSPLSHHGLSVSSLPIYFSFSDFVCLFGLVFVRQGVLLPSNLLCTQGWLRTSGLPASTSQMLQFILIFKPLHSPPNTTFPIFKIHSQF